MTTNFYERLKKYYESAGAVIRGESDGASIFPNRSDIGQSRERAYADFLRLHVPASCQVVFGGFVFGVDGSESAQIDVIVLSSSALRYDLHNRDGAGKTFACVDGTVAVASLKSELDSTQLRSALENLATLPEKKPMQGRSIPGLRLPEAPDWPFKIIFAPTGVASDTLLDTLLDFYKANPNIPHHRRPNLIHVGGKYSVQRPLETVTKAGGQVWPAQSFHVFEDHSDAWALAYAVTKIQETAMGLHFVIQTYGELVNALSFDASHPPRWRRIT
ncbi:MAG: hypothetical protein AMXMBFR56_49410 [Polyangiaceae bacterium]